MGKALVRIKKLSSIEYKSNKSENTKVYILGEQKI